MSTVITTVLWILAIGCGLVAGLYFAFSAFTMTALGRSGTVTAITAMNAINTAIFKSAFMPLFYATSLGSLMIAVARIAKLGWTSICGHCGRCADLFRWDDGRDDRVQCPAQRQARGH